MAELEDRCSNVAAAGVRNDKRLKKSGGFPEHLNRCFAGDRQNRKVRGKKARNALKNGGPL